MVGKESTDILIVGKTGHGKSATANTIVGYKAFQSKGSLSSVTKTAQFEYGEFEGRILKVVDGPGIGDTSLTPEGEGIKLVIEEISFAVSANPAGYHAILLLIKYGARFTKEESEAIRQLKKIFGDDFIKNHGILLMTHGDHFDDRDEETDEPFEEWITLQEGEIQDLITECCGRLMLFNNRMRDEDGNKEQIRRLLGIIDGLAANGLRYTNEIFNKEKQARDKLLIGSTKIHLDEESLKECSLIAQKLAQMKFDDPENSLHILQNLLSRTSKLKESIVLQDQGTNQLSAAINLAEQLNESVIERIKGAGEVLKIKEQMKQMDAELKMRNLQLEDEEKKRKEEEMQHQKEKERQMSKEKENIKQLEKVRKQHEEMMKAMRESMQMQLEKIQHSSQVVRVNEARASETPTICSII